MRTDLRTAHHRTPFYRGLGLAAVLSLGAVVRVEAQGAARFDDLHRGEREAVPAPAQPNAPLVFLTTRAIPLRAAPNGAALRGLPAGEQVALVSATPRRTFFRVRTHDGREGWADGRYLEPPLPSALAPEMVDFALAVGSKYPPCGGAPYYRWAAKVRHAGQLPSATAASVHAMLTTWAIPAFGGHSLAAWCLARAPGPEHSLYRVSGYLRRLRMTQEQDGDWHGEMTAAPGDAVTDCVIIEVPAASYGAVFNTVRTNLLHLVGAANVNATGDLAQPVHVTFVGLGFYDGWHAGSGGLPTGHGRCNSTRGAAWELHPVVAVAP